MALNDISIYVSYVGLSSPEVLITVNSIGNDSIPINFHFTGIAHVFLSLIIFLAY